MQEHLDIVKKQFEKDSYAKSLGIVLDTLTDDTIQMHMQLREDMLNMYNRPHGAIMYSLADTAFSVLGNNKNNISTGLFDYHASPDKELYLSLREKPCRIAGKQLLFCLTSIWKRKGCVHWLPL